MARYADIRRLVAVFLILLSIEPEIYARKTVESLPARSEILAGYDDVDSVKSRLLASGLHAIEGIWQFPSDGARIVIERVPADPVKATLRYRMVVLWSPRRSICPGTVMGVLAPTSKKGVFAASIYSATLGARSLAKPRGYTLTLGDGSRLTMTPDRGRLRVRLSFWRLIPYLSNTIALRGHTFDDTPSDKDGCVRLFPTPARGINGPRYL